MYESHTEAQPKPPCAKKRGGLLGFGLEGMAESSSSGPEGVLMYDLFIPGGRGVPAGGLGFGACHWRAKGPKGMMLRRG